jgi:cytochrome c553
VRRAGGLLLAAIASGTLAADPPPGRAKAQPCTPCHGALGIGVTPDAPHLAGQPRIYLAEQLKAFRSGKRGHEVMNVIARPLSDDDIAALSEWYASIPIEVKEKP